MRICDSCQRQESPLFNIARLAWQAFIQLPLSLFVKIWNLFLAAQAWYHFRFPLKLGTYFAFTRLCKTVSYIWGHLTKTTAKSGRRPKCKKLKVSQLTELPRNSPPPIPSCYPTYPSPSSNIGHSSTPLSTLLTLLPLLPLPNIPPQRYPITLLTQLPILANCPARYVPPYCKFTSGSPEARKEI